MGKRSKLTPELLNRICSLIRDNGMYPAQAALVCGVSESTFYEWLARGRSGGGSSTPAADEPVGPGTRGRGDPQGVYAKFAESINKANAELELALVTDALEKSRKSKNPLAPVILLSRRFRERWSEQIQVAAAGKEALASMERIKAAWDAPEVVDGVYTELPGPIPTPALPEASDTETKGFHLPPPDYTDPDYTEATDTDIDTDQEPDTDQAPHDIDRQDAQPASHAGRGDNQQ